MQKDNQQQVTVYNHTKSTVSSLPATLAPTATLPSPSWLVTESSAPTVNILLIGSTGHGKSTLGNFFLDPQEDHMFTKQTFRTAVDNKPQTQFVDAAKKVITLPADGKKMTLNVIDTPGLNESATKDLNHMVNLIKNLGSIKLIHACVFVVKFNAKIDAQYKATIQYYSKLLPALFQSNVIIVMTDYAQDQRSIKLRERQGINVEQIQRNVIREICENSGITYEPLLFTIDCLPMDKEEFDFNNGMRNTIIDYVHQLNPITTAKTLKVAKTAHIKALDAQAIKKLEGEINGYNERLIEAHLESEDALTKTQSHEAEITKNEQDLGNLNVMRTDFDTEDLVVTKTWCVNEEWKFFRSHTAHFDLQSEFEIKDTKTWTNNDKKCKFKDLCVEVHHATGRVEGSFMRGVYATVELYTYKKLRYNEEIKLVSSHIEQMQKKLEEQKEARREMHCLHAKHLEKIELLEKYIEEKRQKIKELSLDVLNVEDAMKRLQELKAN